MRKPEVKLKEFPVSLMRQYLVSRYDLPLKDINSIIKEITQKGYNRALTKVGMKANLDGYLLSWVRHKFTSYDNHIDRTDDMYDYNRVKNFYNKQALEVLEKLKK